MAISAKELVLRKVAEKAEEMSEALNHWAREELLLSPVQGLQVTICISEEPVISVGYDVRKQKRVFDRDPTEEDWVAILALPLRTRRPYKGPPTEKMLEILRELKEAEKGYHHELSRYSRLREAFNTFFKKHGNQFRVVWAERGYGIRVAR